MEKSGIEYGLPGAGTQRSGSRSPTPRSSNLTTADLEAAERMKAFRDAGLPEDGLLRWLGRSAWATARIAEANRELIVRTLMMPGDTERDLALRFAAAAEHMMPLFRARPSLYALRAHMLEQVRRDVIGAADLESGEIRGPPTSTVCFADLVEFTRLGEEVAPGGARPRWPAASRRWRARWPSRRCGW